MKLAHTEIADLIWYMNRAYEDKAEELKSFSNYQFPAMAAALQALEELGYAITRTTDDQWRKSPEEKA